jgi:hypothetical protein
VRPAGCAGRVASPTRRSRTGGEIHPECRKSRWSPSSDSDAVSSIAHLPGGLSLVPLPATVRPALRRSVVEPPPLSLSDEIAAHPGGTPPARDVRTLLLGR